MSGHSKWKTIKHKKGLRDAKRGKVFTKLGRAITVAAQGGDPDPDSNPTLRSAIDAARQFSMPKENIKRAIERGSGGGEGASFQELVLEGYGPEGVAIICEILTDNRNRTVAEVRKLFDKHGGSLGEQGSAAYIFKDPQNPLFEVKIEDRAVAEKVLALVEQLDEHDDVQSVLANFDIPEEFLSENSE